MNEKHAILFKRVAGSRQLVLETAADLANVLQLDPALWAVIGLPVDAVIFDEKFLRYLDTDSNSRVRPDELISAIRWLLDTLRDHSGIDARTGTLALSAVNPDSADGPALIGAAKLILANLKIPDSAVITLEQVLDDKNIIANTRANGDGVIPPECLADTPELQAYVSDACRIAGTEKDLTGMQGIDRKHLDSFRDSVRACHAWLVRGQVPEIRPFGAATEDFYAQYIALEAKLHEFFGLCTTLSGESESRFAPVLKLDPLDTASMKAFLEKAPAAMPDPGKKLRLSGWVNPLWKAKLAAFMLQAFELKLAASPAELSDSEWQDISSKLTAHTVWLAAKPTAVCDTLSHETLEKYAGDRLYSEVSAIIDSDIRVKKETEAHDKLKKLILFQQNMLVFVNNFICLDSLFDPAGLSIIQPGTLIIDSRHFTLATKVPDIAEHKKIILRSNICVMYLELTTGRPPAVRAMNIAVAITSGTMRNIFIGKRGVFIGGNGVEWDARVIDLVQQPVSITEALQMPFLRFGEFAGKQADRFFSAKSAEVDTNVAADITKKAAALPPPAEKPQTPAVSGSMMLMGGGVGLAAIGSAVAFIANTMKNISVWNVVAVFIGISLVISGPVFIVSIVKLWNRCVSDFLAASGWAVNPRMRLSRKMGLLFTYAPKPPAGSKLQRGDLIGRFSRDMKKNMAAESGHGFLVVMIVLIVLAACLAGAWFWYSTGAAKTERLLKPETPQIRILEKKGSAPAAAQKELPAPAGKAAPVQEKR